MRRVVVCMLLLLGGCAAREGRSTVIVVPPSEDGSSCAPPRGVAVEVLGSGGPIPDDGRASAGYLVWVDGEARVLVDAGGGTFVRFGQSGADLRSIDVIALSHFHTDHSAELPAFIKGMFFMERRDDAVAVLGPAGREPFVGLVAFMHGLFGEQGIFAYLGWALRPGEGSADLELHEISLGPEVKHFDVDGLRIDAVGVQHGPVPAVAYRIEVGATSLVFGGDQNGANPHFVELAHEADLLVMHHAIPEAADPVASGLHARPSEIAETAARAGARRLLISHHMQRSLAELDRSRQTIRGRYGGRLIVAEDRLCVRLDSAARPADR